MQLAFENQLQLCFAKQMENCRDIVFSRIVKQNTLTQFRALSANPFFAVIKHLGDACCHFADEYICLT